RLNLLKPLYHFLRQAWDARERKSLRNSPALVVSRALNLRVLAPEIPGVLDGRLRAGKVRRALLGIDLQYHLARSNQIFKSHFGTLEQLACANGVAAS